MEKFQVEERHTCMVYPRRLVKNSSDTMSRECIAYRIWSVAHQFMDNLPDRIERTPRSTSADPSLQGCVGH